MDVDTIIEIGIEGIVERIAEAYAYLAAGEEEYEGPWDACIEAIAEQGGFL